MSRIRTIKPDFWTSEQVLSCSLNARLLFIGMWNFCDDNGIHHASHMRIKAEIFPCDDVAINDIKSWINELISNNLLREYVVDEKSYWIVTGWKKHQKIDRATAKHPLPQSELRKIADHSMTSRREIIEPSSLNLRVITEASPPEGKGVEGIGKEINIGEVKTSPADNNQSSQPHVVKEIFTHWQTVMNHPHAKLDDKRGRKIKSALKHGYTLDQLKQAIDGCSNTPYNMGQNDSGQRYDDISLILRDAEHIERFMRNVSLQHKDGRNTDDLMVGVI